METGKRIRIDSTVSETTIHEPSDNTLLWDAVRVMVRLLQWTGRVPLAPRLIWRNHTRSAKRRAHAIHYRRGKNRVAHYRELIATTRTTLGYLQDAVTRLADCGGLEAWRAEVQYFMPRIERIIDQAERRVLRGERVPVADKLFSLFEAHTDIIVKGRRKVAYGHKLNLAGGRSGLILDVVIETGNPADAERFVPMLDRQIAIYGPTAQATRRRRRLRKRRQSRRRQEPGRQRRPPSTRNAGSLSKTWSRAAGSTAACATSAPASRRRSPASSAPTA